MARSLRWRLLFWSGLLLVVVVLGFGTALYWQARAARFADIDSELESTQRLLEGALRTFPPWMLEGGPSSERPPGPPGREGGPPPPPPEMFLHALNPAPARGDRRHPVYFLVGTARREVLKASPLPRDYPPAEELLRSLPRTPRPTAIDRGPFRERVVLGPGGTLILVGREIRREIGDLHALGWQILLAGLGAVAIGLVGVWLVSRRAVRPIEQMSFTAASITSSSLSQRINTAEADSELGQLGTILNAMFDRLETAFDQQVRFTADASHELRTPLAVLLSHLELALARPRPAEEYRRTLVTCQRAARRMQSLVCDLLTLARADAGRLELVREPVDLGLLAEESLTLLEPLAAEHRVTLVPPTGTLEVPGDPDRLSQVLTNLLTNAILYNHPEGTVTVRFRTEGDHAEIIVTDTGLGIPVEHLPHVFERFYRVDSARSRENGGSGLGLAICHSIVTAHGGTIAVTSEPDVGTTFVVRLPLVV